MIILTEYHLRFIIWAFNKQKCNTGIFNLSFASFGVKQWLYSCHKHELNIAWLFWVQMLACNGEEFAFTVRFILVNICADYLKTHVWLIFLFWCAKKRANKIPYFIALMGILLFLAAILLRLVFVARAKNKDSNFLE